jgi:hypothetical protein
MHRLTAVFLCGIVLGGSPAVWAQSSLQIPLQFDFVNPGAKSLALAGAFAGMADDATAAFANPAGLRDLGRPEMSAELRGRWFESPFLRRGRLSGPVQNIGTDVIEGPDFGLSPDNSFRVPYLSVVFPRPRPKFGWVIAGFRHELARIDQRSFAEGVFQKDPSEFTSRRDFPQAGLRQISVTSYGAAGAVEINPRLAVGGTLSVYTLDLNSDYRRYDVDGFFGPPVLTTELGRSTQTSNDVTVTPSVGARVCWKPCAERDKTSVRFGAVYRHGPTFQFDTQDGPNARTSKFRIPHTFAAGAGVEVPGEGRRLLVSVEVTWLDYSRLRNDFLTDQAVGQAFQDNVEIHDGTEFHAGVQYTLENFAWLPRLRAGIWTDPDHSPEYVINSPPLSAADRLIDEKLTVALSTGENRVHYTGGIGFTLKSVELNVGLDVTSHASVLSTSMILKLGR